MVLLCAAAAFLQAGSKHIAFIRFKFIDNEVVAQARLNGKGPYSVFLDTGTAPSVIDLKVVREIGLKFTGHGSSGSGGGTKASTFHEVTIPDVDMGDHHFKNVKALATDLSGMSKKFGHPIGVVFGDSLFDGKVVQFQYSDNVVQIYDGGFYRGSPTPAAVKLPFRHVDGEIRVSGVKINGIPVIANLDTGSNSGFSITPAGIRKVHLQYNVRVAKPTKAAGFNGEYESRAGIVGCLSIKSVVYQGQAVTFWLPGTGHDDRPWDMNIGNAVLLQYIVTIDYVRHVVYLDHEFTLPAPYIRR